VSELWFAREASLGKDDVGTLNAMAEVSLCLDMQEKFDSAEILYQDALRRLEASVGMEHEGTRWVAGIFARMFEKKARREQATKLRTQFGIVYHGAGTSSTPAPPLES